MKNNKKQKHKLDIFLFQQIEQINVKLLTEFSLGMCSWLPSAALIATTRTTAHKTYLEVVIIIITYQLTPVRNIVCKICSYHSTSKANFVQILSSLHIR